MTRQPDSSDELARELHQLVGAGRFREALDLRAQIGDPPVGTRPEVELLAATAATRLGELGLGVTLAESALEHFRSRTDVDGRMRAMNLLGAIAFEHGRLEDAERCFGEALDLARSIEDTRMAAHASNNLGSVAHLRNQSDVALSLYRSALLAYQRLGDRRGTAQTYHNLGLAFRERENWLDADAAALQAVRHAEAVGEGGLLALAVMGRAEIHLGRGEFDLARQELGRAQRAAEGAGDDVGQAEIDRLRALLSLREGRNAQAAAEALAARAAGERLGILQLKAEAAGLAAVALRRLGQPVEAERYAAEAYALFDQMGAEKLRQDLERLLG